MPKDYASKQKCIKMGAAQRRRRRGRPPQKRQYKTLWLTTLLLIFVFSGSLHYLSKHKRALLQDLKNNETHQVITKSAPKPKLKAIKILKKPKVITGLPSTKPKFDFYNLLTKEKVKVPSSASYAQYILAVKTVASPKAADHSKAELALLGFDVTVNEVDTPKGIAYKVVVGPYATKKAALADQKRLKENHVASSVEKGPEVKH